VPGAAYVIGRLPGDIAAAADAALGSGGGGSVPG
jgi:hypothetical protein